MAKEDILDRPDRIAVYLDRIVDIRGITAAHSRDDRHLMLQSKFKNRSIATE